MAPSTKEPDTRVKDGIQKGDMLFTINFDQTRKMEQEEAAKDNALAEASAMTKTEAANLAWAKEGQIFISGVQRNHLGKFGVFYVCWCPHG